MRNAFIDELCLAAEQDSSIFLIVGDLGFGVVENFVRRFPNQFINAGVSEQNMMGLAAGLASEGNKVFVYSIANFPTFRCAEQIRNDVDYHKLPVTIVSVGGGLSYGNLGYSHHAVQDFSLMRTMPNMLIAAPGDPMEVRACMRYLLKNPQPSYLRLAKAGEPSFHKKIPYVEPGKWIKVKNGSLNDIFLTTSGGLGIAMDRVVNNFEVKEFSIYSLPLWGMKYKKYQPLQIETFKSVVTVEDHLLDGGFGSWMLEALCSKAHKTKVTIKAFNSAVCGMVGSDKSLLSKSDFWGI